MKKIDNYFLQSKKISSINDYITEKLRLNKDIIVSSNIDSINNEFVEKISEYLLNSFNIKANKSWENSVTVSDSKKYLTVTLYGNRSLYYKIMTWINNNLKIRQNCKRNSTIIYVYPKYD